MSGVLDWLKLHAPPTALVVAVLAWIFGRRVSGATLQDVGEVVTLVLGGAHLPAAGQATAGAARSVRQKLTSKS